jgi:hypothetical protein
VLLKDQPVDAVLIEVPGTKKVVDAIPVKARATCSKSST